MNVKQSNFQVAYQKGYRDGFREGTRKPSNAIIKEDMRYIYGGLMIVLKQKYNSSVEELEDVIMRIQQFWVNESERKLNRKPGEPFESTPQYVERITGIDITQVEGEEDEQEEQIAE